MNTRYYQPAPQNKLVRFGKNVGKWIGVVAICVVVFFLTFGVQVIRYEAGCIPLVPCVAVISR